MDKIIIGLISGIIAAFFTVFFTNRKERNILIEKWMNLLRDEVSKFLGLCENLRLLDGKKIDFSNPIYGNLIASKFKIEMLLNKAKPDQLTLTEYINKCLKLTEVNNFTDYKQAEAKIVNITILILQEHWDKISSEMRQTILLRNLWSYIKQRVTNKT